MSNNAFTPQRYAPGAAPLLFTFFLLFAAFEASAQRLEFDVYLEERPIGSHEFVFEETDNLTQVSINADFKVKILFVTAFNYQHRNTETWQNNCLQKIDAKTVVNGKVFEVSGNQAVDQFEIVTPNAADAIAGPIAEPIEAGTDCARSFAYWDRSLLPPPRSSGVDPLAPLLNAQTGEFVPATLTDLGKGKLTIGDTPVDVNRYRLTGKDVQVTLAYAETANGDEEWVGLSSKVQGGRTLNYVRTQESLAQSSASR